LFPPPASSPPQDDAAATHAAKLQREEAVLDFSQPAAVCHNKVRGFAGWPSTFAIFEQVADSGSGSESDASSSSGGGSGSEIELKILRARVAEPSTWRGSSEREVTATREGLFIRCGDGSVLQVGWGWVRSGGDGGSPSRVGGGDERLVHAAVNAHHVECRCDIMLPMFSRTGLLWWPAQLAA